MSEIDKIVSKHIQTIRNDRELFLQAMIKKHCTWWQKLRFKFAVLFKRRVKFIEAIIQDMPHELNSEFLGINYGTTQMFGVKINGKIYWKPKHSDENP